MGGTPSTSTSNVRRFWFSVGYLYLAPLTASHSGSHCSTGLLFREGLDPELRPVRSCTTEQNFSLIVPLVAGYEMRTQRALSAARASASHPGAMSRAGVPNNDVRLPLESDDDVGSLFDCARKIKSRIEAWNILKSQMVRRLCDSKMWNARRQAPLRWNPKRVDLLGTQMTM